MNDAAALERVDGIDITALTDKATGSTFYTDDLTPEQVEANKRVVSIAADTALAAAANAHQLFTAAFVEGEFPGYMIATVHLRTTGNSTG